MLKILAPLLISVSLLAWGATWALGRTAQTWFERDVGLRARLAVAGARGSLAEQLARRDRRRLAALLEEITRDDRITAMAACGPDGKTVARTSALPDGLACRDLTGVVPADPAARLAWGGIDFERTVPSGNVRVSLLPVIDDDAFAGSVVVVHDMSWVARREAAMRRLTLGVFAVVGILAYLLTVLLRRLNWRDWSRELRDLVLHPRFRRGGRATRGAAFQPIASELRQLLAELSREQSGPTAGHWSPERLQDVLERALGGDGVVVLANREPYLHSRTESGEVKVLHPASGLVTALEPVMRACSGTWVAHGSGNADREHVDGHDRVKVPPGEEAYTLRRVWLSPEEERGYYYGFANEGLWPLSHIAHARPLFRTEDWRQYQLVNERFAEAACREAKGPDPVILVQDYHFALVPRMIRHRLPRATIISFWHIPWPNAEHFGICPWAREILTGLLGSSVVGFHTQLHCNNFLESVDRFLEARIDRESQAVVLGGHESLVRSYPISIEWPNHWARAAPPPLECRRTVFDEQGLAPDALLGVGVDRIDYTKGIEERLLAVERMLERSPHLQGRFTFAQLGAPSRTLIDRYRALNESVEALANRINERFATGTYRPIVLLRASHEPPTVYRYLRAADVCYVSSLHDGMNLVAKEFVSARDDERGVLVLSRFTGAARELTQALIVNPYDLDEASAALAAAVEMSPEEQADRMRAMRAFVSEFNVYRWAGRMLVDAARVRQHGRLSDRLTPVLRAVVPRR